MFNQNMSVDHEFILDHQRYDRTEVLSIITNIHQYAGKLITRSTYGVTANSMGKDSGRGMSRRRYQAVVIDVYLQCRLCFCT